MSGGYVHMKYQIPGPELTGSCGSRDLGAGDSNLGPAEVQYSLDTAEPTAQFCGMVLLRAMRAFT